MPLDSEKNITDDNFEETNNINIFKYINEKDEMNNNNLFLLKENENKLEGDIENCEKCFFNEYKCEINLCKVLGYKEILGYIPGTKYKYPIIKCNKYFKQLEEYEILFSQDGD